MLRFVIYEDIIRVGVATSKERELRTPLNTHRSPPLISCTMKMSPPALVASLSHSQGHFESYIDRRFGCGAPLPLPHTLQHQPPSRASQNLPILCMPWLVHNGDGTTIELASPTPRDRIDPQPLPLITLSALASIRQRLYECLQNKQRHICVHHLQKK